MAGVASTPTTPVRVVSAAGFTAGSMPTKGTSGKVARRCFNAAAEAALQATTINLQSRPSKKRVIASENDRISSSVARAVGDVNLIGEVERVFVRQLPGNLAPHAQAADAGIENTDG